MKCYNDTPTNPPPPRKKPESFNLQNNLFYILIQAISLISIPKTTPSLSSIA